jgi:hypothetical protein
VAVGGRRQIKLGIEWVSYQLRQIYADYNIPTSVEEISIDEIRFFYVPMIDSLCKIQKGLNSGR